MELAKTIAKNITDFRKRNNLNRNELAHKLQVSQTKIWSLEQGESLPRIDILLSLAKEFNISIDELLTDKSTENQEKIISEIFTLFSVDQNRIQPVQLKLDNNENWFFNHQINILVYFLNKNAQYNIQLYTGAVIKKFDKKTSINKQCKSISDFFLPYKPVNISFSDLESLESM